VAHEMERVGHYDTVKLWKVESLGKVCGYVLDCCGGKVGAQGFFLISKGSLVFVDCVNLACWSDQVGQGEGEGACA